MDDRERMELLKAALAVAVADGEIRRSEMGVVKGLAKRVGVEQASLDAMLEAAKQDNFISSSILMRSKQSAQTALELLVAEARIDGQVSEEERDVLVRIASSLGILGDDFQAVYEAGIARADAIRKARRG